MSGFLECDHCGGVAVESKDGLFGEGDADRCQSCGIAGHITVEENDCDGDCAEDNCTCNTAYFSPHDWDENAWCNRSDCEDCANVRRDAEIKRAREALRADAGGEHE